MAEKTNYYVLKEKAVPDVLLRVVEAKRLLESGRAASVQEEISWIESRREEMLDFWSKVESGAIPRRVTHNDTKINNVLFDMVADYL